MPASWKSSSLSCFGREKRERHVVGFVSTHSHLTSVLLAFLSVNHDRAMLAVRFDWQKHERLSPAAVKWRYFNEVTL